MLGRIRYAITGGLLFVYGTLQKGEEAHHKLEGSSFLGAVKTAPRYTLTALTYLGEGYYGVEPRGQDQIEGELYRVSPEVLAQLDKWEEHYKRDYIMLEDGRVAEAYLPAV